MASASSMSTLSVISRTSWRGARPDSASTWATSSDHPGWTSCLAETLTLMRSCSPEACMSAHVAACRHASASTYRPEGHDEAGLLGGGDELQRREQAPHRVLPAHEGLEAGDGAGVEVDDGLVVEPELALGDAPAQVVLHRQPLGGVGQHGLVEDLVAVPAAVLGPVHGHVGVPQEQLGRRPGRGADGHADAGGERQVARPGRGTASRTPPPPGTRCRRPRGSRRCPRRAGRTRRLPCGRRCRRGAAAR